MSEKEDYLRLILDGAHDGRFQMVRDEFLLRNQIQTKNKNPILRFYRFSEPTFTVGYGLWSKVHSSLTGKIPVVRRITGGGIVSHKESDLTYAFIIPYTSFISLRKARGSYLFIHEALKRALVDFGVRTHFFEGCGENQKSSYCFESPVLYDVMLGQNKVAGAGQKRTLGFLLHQGSIAWDLLIQAEPELSEIDFCTAFSKHLAKMLNIPIKEIPFNAEEMEQVIPRHCEEAVRPTKQSQSSEIASLTAFARNDGLK